jgi:hypothetical protein
MAISKTNALRLLDHLGVCSELHEDEVDPDDRAFEPVARKVGIPSMIGYIRYGVAAHKK